MADDFASSFIRSYSAVKDIRARKEDREYLREQRARKRGEDARDDKYRKDVGEIARGTTQVSTAPETDTVSPETVSRPPEGFTVDDVPGTGGMPAPKKSVASNMATKLADGVKSKVAGLFGTNAPGEGSIGEFGMPGGGGAAPELTRDSTSNRIGATRAQTPAEQMRAMAVASAEVNPDQAFRYMQMADKEDVNDKIAELWGAADTDAGLEKAWESVHDGTTLTSKRVTEGEDKGRTEYFSNGKSVGVYDSGHDLIYEKVMPIAAKGDASFMVSLFDKQTDNRRSEAQLKEARRNRDQDVAFRDGTRELEERRLAIAESTAAQGTKHNAVQLRKAEAEQAELDQELGLRKQYKSLLVNPVKNGAELEQIEQELLLMNPNKYSSSETTLSPPDTDGVQHSMRTTVNTLGARRKASLPKIDDKNSAVAKSELAADIAAGKFNMDAFTEGFERNYGRGYVDLLRRQDPEFAAMIEAAENPKAPPRKAGGMPTEPTQDRRPWWMPD